MNEYDGHWMTTYTGKKFHYRNPFLSEICIEDIAHHLSLICRFTGACREFYSVAEHSIRVAEIVPSHLKLSALLHDAAEAYLNDISRPVKYSHKLDETERGITRMINAKFGIATNVPEIKYADAKLLATEARDIMPNTDGWAELPDPLRKRIKPLSWQEAEVKFNNYYHKAVKIGYISNDTREEGK